MNKLDFTSNRVVLITFTASVFISGLIILFYLFTGVSTPSKSTNNKENVVIENVLFENRVIEEQTDSPDTPVSSVDAGLIYINDLEGVEE